MKKAPTGLIALLKPHAKPYAGVLVLVLFLGWITASLQQGVILLISPTWKVIFPEETATTLTGQRASLSRGELERIASELDGWREAGLDFVIDAHGKVALELPEGGDTGLPPGTVLAPGEFEQIESKLEGWSQAGADFVVGTDGTFTVAFPDEASGLSAEAPGALDRITSQFEEWREAGIDFVLGTDGTVPVEDRMGFLMRLAVIISFVALVAAAAQFFFNMLSRWAALRMIVGLRMSIARHLMGLSLRYHGQRHFGDLLSRVSADVGTTLNVVNTALRDLVMEPMLALCALAGAFFIMPQATMIVLLALPVLVVPIRSMMKRVRKGSHKSLTELGASVQVLSQMFQGVRTVKAFRAEERELERYQDINERYIGSTMAMVRATAMSRSWTILYTHVGLGLLVLFIGWLSIHGGLSNGGNILVFFLLISRVYSAIKSATRSWSSIEEARGAAIRLQEVLDETADVVERDDAVEVDGLGDGIRLEGVSLTYPGSDEKALDSLDLHVRPGETLALVGPSGSGKSTLVDLVARFLDPTEGRITVGGRDLRDVSIDSWSKQYAIVTQEPFLFHASIEENILYGKPEASEEEVRSAASAANIRDFVEGLPEGYKTNVADAGTRLSGGQRQRITIARAVLHGAPLILLDEATSALDTESEAVVQAALQNMLVGHTAIVIAHRLSTVRDADRIAVLEGGHLVELGTHDELLARGGLYSRLHAAQFAEDVSVVSPS